MNVERTDVVVVGASLAGCSAARVLAQQGLRVRVVEREASPESAKRVCTHLIQNSALPALRRMGFLQPMMDAGARPTGLQLWTSAGWARLTPDEEEDAFGPTYNLNLRRQTLDPLIRRLTVATPGVELSQGISLRDLVIEGGRVRGVEVESRDGRRTQILARLVVGADGRNSRTAQLAKIQPESTPNLRGGYQGYFRNVTLQSGRDTQLWMLERDVAYTFPTDGGLTVLALVVPKEEHAEFKKDVGDFMRRRFAGLPNAPDLSRAEQVGEFVGLLDAPNLYRRPNLPGLALAGDAALATDYVWGQGCGWAFQSGELLARTVGPALAQGHSLDAAVKAYVKDHRRLLYWQHQENQAFSNRLDLDPMRRLMFTTAAHDPELARRAFALVSGRVGKTRGQLSALARALAVRATLWARRREEPRLKLISA